MTQHRHVTGHDLFFTRWGRKWLEEWCDKTPLEGDAKQARKTLAKARESVPDSELPE